MAFVGNFVWFIFGGGIILGLAWFLSGIIFCLTIIGIPFGIAAFRIASFAFFPFGKELIPAELIGEKPVFGSGFMNVIWCILSGFWLALGHIIIGICDCLGLITIPFGLANFKIAQAAFAPLGKRIVTLEVAAEAKRCKAQGIPYTPSAKQVPPQQ